MIHPRTDQCVLERTDNASCTTYSISLDLPIFAISAYNSAQTLGRFDYQLGSIYEEAAVHPASTQESRRHKQAAKR
jgi:hypothetical protein